MNYYQDTPQPEKLREDIITIENPLDLSVDDTKLIRNINNRLEAAEKFEKKINLRERQKRNENYLFGRQIEENDLKKYNARYMDNIIYEAEETIKPIALSRLPDLYVTDGANNANNDISKLLTDLINSEIRQRENRRALGVAFKNLPAGFIGAIKYRWNPELGDNGDYEFFPIHYSRLTLDPDAKSNDIREHNIIFELVPTTAQEIIMKFPDKKEEFLQSIGFKDTDLEDDNKLATPLYMREIWFKWYEKKGDGWSIVNGVMWKYKNVLLGKMKNPNWDWEGEDCVFKYDEKTKAKTEATADDMQRLALNPMMSGFTTEKVTKNYLQSPEFPYILIGYDQFGNMPYDETSRIEQVIWLQDNVNKRGKQITEMADRAKGKHIFFSGAINKEEIEENDMDDPDISIIVDGPVNSAHSFIPGEQPSAALFQDQDIQRNRIFQKMGTNSTTRGDKETDVATTAQILRESDFGRIDDIVEETINFAAERMAQAAFQLIKLRYTEEHFKTITGKDGSTTYAMIHSDMINPSMKIVVHASGVDKMMRKREAYEKAQMKLIDPLTFFEDTDSPNPKERAMRLMMFMSDPAGYTTKYLMDLETTGQQVAALNGQEPQPEQAQLPPGGNQEQQPQPEIGASGNQAQITPDSGGQDAINAIMQIEQGVMPQPPMQITPQYVSTIDQYLQSPQFQAQNQQIKQMVTQFAQHVVNMAGGTA